MQAFLNTSKDVLEACRKLTMKISEENILKLSKFPKCENFKRHTLVDVFKPFREK